MKKLLSAGAVVAMLGVGSFAVAELADGYKSVAPPEGHPLSEVISGYEFRIPSTQETQDDEFQNPGYLLMDEAAEIWETADGAKGMACSDCHGDAADSMKGVGATYPKHTEQGDRRAFRNVENQINFCRTERMEAEPWKYDKPEMLGMTVLIRNVDNGEPVNVSIAGDAEEYFELGKEIYYTRYGQLDLACSHCHEDNYGNYIRADHLSQGQINGFPTYRMKWQGLGSTHRRFKGCMDNIRAEPFERGGKEFLALELYTAWRGQSLPVETPAVRN